MKSYFSGDSVRACGISGPLLRNDKVPVCYCSSLLCLIVSLSCSSSPSLINSILFWVSPLPFHNSNMSILLEKSSFNTDLISQQREKQERRTIFPAESDSPQSFSSLLTLKSHDWNTEYGYLHSRSFVLLCTHSKSPKKGAFSSPVFCC